MTKGSHFRGQPLYGQVIKSIDKSKILNFSRENGGERYTKRFNANRYLVAFSTIQCDNHKLLYHYIVGFIHDAIICKYSAQS